MRSAYLSGLNMHPAYLYPSNYAGMAAVKDEIRRRQKKWYISTIYHRNLMPFETTIGNLFPNIP